MPHAAKDLEQTPSSQPEGNDSQPHDRATPLAARIAEIKSEARRDPEAYLRDSVVPEGGE